MVIIIGGTIIILFDDILTKVITFTNHVQGFINLIPDVNIEHVI